MTAEESIADLQSRVAHLERLVRHLTERVAGTADVPDPAVVEDLRRELAAANKARSDVLDMLAEVQNQQGAALAELVDVRARLEASEVERLRLRKALTTIGAWDSLNPPAPGTDLPWLRQLVDEALGEGEGR